jgi:hypothetical protein
MKDGAEANNIVGTYVSLYNKYLNYMDSIMTGSDSAQVLAIANLCPLTEGNAVYQAQAFYRILFNDDTTQFSSSCDMDTSAKGVNPAISDTKSPSYKLYPNPNNGSFELQQVNRDTNPVTVVVKNVLGSVVYQKAVEFTSGAATLQLANLPSGVYLLQLTDSQQKSSNFKFVIQK